MSQRGTGWIMFSSIVLIFAGLARIIDAIWAFSYNGALPDELKDALIGDTLSNYGWFFLVVGIVLMGAGFAVLEGSQVARWIGIVGGVIAGLSAMVWMPYYPVWSLMYVTVAFLVVYGLGAYGGRDTAGDR